MRASWGCSEVGLGVSMCWGVGSRLVLAARRREVGRGVLGWVIGVLV